MSRYQAVINTDGYKLMPCSKKNWEAGTINDFMLAINGWKSTERSLQEVRWRIERLTARKESGYEHNNKKRVCGYL